MDLLESAIPDTDSAEVYAVTHWALKLATRSLSIGPMPQLSDTTLKNYKLDLNEDGRFGWTVVHTILERVPEWSWTGYYCLAEAAGTSAQAVDRKADPSQQLLSEDPLALADEGEAELVNDL